ncbi:anti-sigma factor antagonist [Candidatus Sumerlaeota bacterium]|nr:anti-sigma factor antagonist [Candidatus Sumerlaeota bacterium]
MELKFYEANGNLLVKLRGRVVLDECDRMKSTIVPAIGPGVSQINLDLSDVDFIDSAGLGALVGIKVSANKHRARIALINPSRGVSDILMVSKLDSIFDIITGSDADALLRQVAQPQFAKTPAGAAPAASPSGPAMPVMPASASSASGTAGAGSKDRIDQLCKDAVDHMRRGDYDGAAQAYREAIEINAEYLPAHNNLAIVYEKKPEWRAEAIAQWKRVLDLSTRNSDQKHIDRARKHLATLER